MQAARLEKDGWVERTNEDDLNSKCGTYRDCKEDLNRCQKEDGRIETEFRY